MFFFTGDLRPSPTGMYSEASTLAGFFVLPLLGLLSMDQEGLGWPRGVSPSCWVFFFAVMLCSLGLLASFSAPRLPVPGHPSPRSRRAGRPWPHRPKGPWLRRLLLWAFFSFLCFSETLATLVTSSACLGSREVFPFKQETGPEATRTSSSFSSSRGGTRMNREHVSWGWETSCPPGLGHGLGF